MLALATADAAEPVPTDFPRFAVPGHEHEMDSLRQLYWLHYPTGGPLATLWDDWMPAPTLWPAVTAKDAMNSIRSRWRQALSGRNMDAEGYVATHQHASIAHQQGWPFPFWALSPEGWGWHFSLQGLSPAWHATTEKKQDGWTIVGGQDQGIADGVWSIRLDAAHAAIQPPPPMKIGVLQAPFLQLRWRATGLGNAQPFVEWATEKAPEFSPERRMYFPPVESANVVYTMIPVFRHPKWLGPVTALRIQFGNPKPGGTVGIRAFFTQYDTRHPINNPNFVRGCAKYFWWTRDINFLREQMQRIRLAIRYMMTECRTLDEKCVVVPYVGHCGRSGLDIKPDGSKTLRPGYGIGNHYWDILPGGHKDAIATLYYYDALRCLATLERDVSRHAEWDIPASPMRFDPAWLEGHAAEVRERSGRLFWNPQTKRFHLGLDVDGRSYDYGYTFMNLEAVCYGFATPEQEQDILSWITGERSVEGDTSKGADLYHWRFGPRASTKRNLEWYGWYWSDPGSVPWGGQVQDGGAVLGFAYHDMMARLRTRGPDDAWGRLRETIAWFDDVQKAGGYRAYYKDPSRGTMQGGGTAGGLGLDMEFFESILVPQVVFDGFLGFRPTSDGCAIRPNLPRQWPELTVDRIHVHNVVLKVRATSTSITIDGQGYADAPFMIEVPPGPWRLEYRGTAGQTIRTEEILDTGANVRIPVDWAAVGRVELSRLPR